MARRTRHDAHQDDEPANLEVEKRELVEPWDALVPEENHTSRQDVRDLVDDERLPGLDLQIRMIKRVQSLD